MSLKLRLARAAARFERWWDRLFKKPQQARVIEPYVGYATPEQLILRGRILANIPGEISLDHQSRLKNVRQMIRMFATDEVADVEVSAHGVTALSDEEGYFTLVLPRDTPLADGAITVSAGELRADCPVVLPAPDARFAVVSDIDDTMMKTGAYSLAKNLWTSLTGNPHTRHVFPDAIELMTLLSEGGRNPVYFVSSSPWNFHGFLQEVFALNDLPRAPMFLRDYGISDTQFITGTHGDHKGSAIDRIMAAHPDLPLILIGDTGQHDAEVYLHAAERHPGRVAEVILHEPGDGLGKEDTAPIEALRAMGVPVRVGSDYGPAIAALRAAHFTVD